MTARLALVELRQPTSVIGTGTVHCVRPGFFYGLAGMIAEHVSSELGEKITVIATGGPAWKIAAASRSIHEINENLTLQGLEYISRRNQTTRLYSKYPIDDASINMAYATSSESDSRPEAV